LRRSDPWRQSDWRLPNIRELESLVDYGRLDPCIDPIFPTTPTWHWSSDSLQNDPDDAWIIHFSAGYMSNGVKFARYPRVRCAEVCETELCAEPRSCFNCSASRSSSRGPCRGTLPPAYAWSEKAGWVELAPGGTPRAFATPSCLGASSGGRHGVDPSRERKTLQRPAILQRLAHGLRREPERRELSATHGARRRGGFDSIRRAGAREAALRRAHRGLRPV